MRVRTVYSLKRRPPDPPAQQGSPAFPKPTPRKLEKKAMRLVRAAATAALRETAMTRAKGRCENPFCVQGIPRHGYAEELDHWLGGTGRRHREASPSTVWMLCGPCHRARTANDPSAAYWNDCFRAFCARHGYTFTPHRTRIDG